MDTNIVNIEGGVCAPAGFLAAAAHAAIKRIPSKKDDLAVVYSESPCIAAAVFTTNRVKAAPVQISRLHLRSPHHHGVILNSGNANACTGKIGLSHAKQMTHAIASALGHKPVHFLVCSTGRIGVPLPIEKILQTIPSLVSRLSPHASHSAATAIMTSDTFPKEAALQISSPNSSFRIGAIAKGAGMIAPNMATMLSVITTDAAIEKKLAQSLLLSAVNQSFNRITVDGDTSTNDSVILLANGLSKTLISHQNPALLESFLSALQSICLHLAHLIVKDGEGTTRVVKILVENAKSPNQAKKAAQAVANSILLKCALAGADPNWGRILDALGYSGATFNPSRINLFYENLHVVKDGTAGPDADSPQLKTIAEKKEFTIRIQLNSGSASHWLLTTDLTEEYVRLNLSE
ncbi:MAG: bifunctional glutamate N-acetyltransferase/amino-acid acetyltransferase ArgJ [Chthoniobacterales bacterium]|nr:bifunctional glutamate N-acetyltransferase/amino-acid acetyltransferase ArgJ [Chthoniobacterales bacterium]MCX7713732.1 bifunctional glutamate N-acetyltransferase/amino-acid acetyltransferase ArgJ [Chthoniobacterales bacterium]